MRPAMIAVTVAVLLLPFVDRYVTTNSAIFSDVSAAKKKKTSPCNGNNPPAYCNDKTQK